MKQFRIGSSTFTSLTGFVVVFWVFWAPNAPRYPRRRLGRWSWWKGREGRSSRKQPKWQETWSHIHLWSIIAIQIILTYRDYETIIIIGDDHYDDHYYCHHHWGPCSKVWESFPLAAKPNRSKPGYWPNICTTNTKKPKHIPTIFCACSHMFWMCRFSPHVCFCFPGKIHITYMRKKCTNKDNTCAKKSFCIFFCMLFLYVTIHTQQSQDLTQELLAKCLVIKFVHGSSVHLLGANPLRLWTASTGPITGPFCMTQILDHHHSPSAAKNGQYRGWHALNLKCWPTQTFCDHQVGFELDPTPPGTYGWLEERLEGLKILDNNQI